MGNKNNRHKNQSGSNSNQWNISNFQQVSGLDTGRVQEIQQMFQRAAGSDGLISRNEFDRVYQELNLGPYDRASIDRSFRTIDRDGSGKLSFDEFLSAVVMLNNNIGTRERVTYLIDSNNPDGYDQTYITPEYGRTIVRDMNDYYGTNANFDDIWSGAGRNNGQIRRDEFVTYVSQDPTFGQYF